jgi:hypothetical protein
VTRTRALLLVSALSACRERAPEVSRPAPAIEMPGPGPVARAIDATAQDAACAGCHADAARDHAGSLHRRAFTDGAFQAAYRAEPLPFCRDCHAPERDATLGVSCVTCHAPRGVTDGAVLAAPRPRDVDGHASRRSAGSAPRTRARETAPHAIVRDARFGTAWACAGCHEFAFPAEAQRTDGAKMQRTVTEHARSPFAATPCSTCHMPAVPETRARSHRFAASRDLTTLRGAVRVQAASTADGVDVTLVAGLVGHAFPTGDLFRRLRVSAVALGDGDAVLAEAEASLGRHLRFTPNPSGGAPLQTELWDDRVMPDAPRTVHLSLRPAPEVRVIRWRVEYQRARSANGEEIVIEGAETLAEGTLAPPR